MGFLRRLFGGKKQNHPSPNPKEKRRWSFVRSSNTESPNSSSLFSSNNKYTVTTTSLSTSGPYEDGLDANKHAIAVAAATAAVAEAALAAAQAAAEVVRLTSGGGTVRCSNGGSSEVHHRWWVNNEEAAAAVKIQSAFRGYLARRALRALKALVKLQAHVRGHIVRKQTADMLRRMQTLVRVQARARATRSHVSKSFHSIGQLDSSRRSVFSNLGKNEQLRVYGTASDGPCIKRCGSNSNVRDVNNVNKTQMGSNWLNRWMEDSLWNNQREPSARHRHADDERNDKILEVDTWKPHLDPQHINRSFRTQHHVFASDFGHGPTSVASPQSTKARNQIPIPSVSSMEVSSPSSLKSSMRKDEAASRTAQNSPRLLSASSRPGSSSNARQGPFTPARSECSWGYYGGYAGHPNYMSNTESSRAKVRSQSAPRQRLELESSGSTRRTFQGFLDTSISSENGHAYTQYGESRNYGYPDSRCLNRPSSPNVR